MELMTHAIQMPWYGWIAIVSGSISGIVKMRIDHAERLEMIRHGMHPDQPREKSSIREL